jgi:hypothetical protein
MTAAKVLVTLALMPAPGRSGPVEYRTLAELPGLAPGSPVTLAGQRIGRIVRSERRGDTTVLRVRFNRGADRLPGSRIVRLRRIGLAGSDVIALDMWCGERRMTPSFARGGVLHVQPSLRPRSLREDPRPRLDTPPPPPPILRLIPLAPRAPRGPFVST